MNKKPPHLPPASCRIDTYYRLRSLFGLVLLVFISFLAGLAATLSVFAWVIPMTNDQVALNTLNRTNSWDLKSNIDAATQHSIRLRLVSIYDKRYALSNGFYNESAQVGKAVVLSSDGWAVMHVENTELLTQKNISLFEALDYKGEKFVLEKVQVDKEAKVVYVKLQGNGFHVAAFTDWDRFDVDSLLWSVDWNKWKQVYVDQIIKGKEKTLYPIWETQYAFVIAPEIREGTLLFDKSGYFVGFAGGENTLLWAWKVEEQLGKLLDGKPFAYSVVKVDGFVADIPPGSGVENITTGFSIQNTNGNTLLKTGDVILKIDGELVNPKILDRQIMLAEDNISLVIWRNGEKLDVQVPKVQL
ncbi:MAG: hypothetical protein V1848_02385 [Candidatus Magasanikbacteria bacterium]